MQEIMIAPTILLVWVIFAITCSYKLAYSKTETPLLVFIIGIFLAFIPPISIIFLVILVIKNKVVRDESTA